MPTVGRINSTNDLQIKGEIIETQVNPSTFSLDEFGNFYLSNGELIERTDVVTGTGSGVYYSETTQSEFEIGTLTRVNAESDGTVKLAGENSTTYPNTIMGSYNVGAYGIGFTVNEPVVLNGWKFDINLTTQGKGTNPETINFRIYDNYTFGDNLTGRTPIFSHDEYCDFIGIHTITGLGWVLPKGNYWLGVINSSFTGIKREYGGTWGTHPKTSVGGSITSIKACRHDGYTVGQDNWYFCWEWELLLNSTGNRVTNPIDLSPVTNVSSSVINWVETEPSGSTLTIDTSIDGGSTWQSATNGGSITGINVGDNLNGKTLMIRQSFTLGTSTTSPSLDSLEITINQASTETTNTFSLNLKSTDFEVRTIEEGVIF